MSKLSIYETNWIDLVFENRNRAYGAYSLRQENTKTSLFALFIGALLLTAAISIPMIYNYLNPEHRIASIVPDIPVVLVDLTTYVPPQTKEERTVMPEIKKPITESINTNDQLINPEIVQSSLATPDIATNIELKNITNSNTAGAASTGLGVTTPTGTNSGTSTPGITDNTVVSSAALDKMPEFPGGIKKFYSYVGTNFENPEIDSESAIRVNVSFVIEKDGSMTDIKVIKDPGYGLGTEAIRVLKSLKTKWAPGMIEGKAVRTAYNLPITIQPN
ncbi:energy transducer TonB [Flavobacterium laiguense]|uniref:Ferric siderophore ABC transporter substrate-binding protein n=1 Tax=Flavobacterium laiguense TaxID=2169409 RepID=A0A2U1JXG2_9FLAO|nr:energy transducer TonB [Flavobacterium laiguense]PWA09634.1 ferric siderophore ABC transporter substrate-binding protein [Flavobacterium laiguense]